MQDLELSLDAFNTITVIKLSKGVATVDQRNSSQ
jgi:hypothetical protein